MSALKSSWDINARTLSWAIDLLDEEDELEQMLVAMLAFTTTSARLSEYPFGDLLRKHIKRHFTVNGSFAFI